jgi:hypothetical protein
MMKGVNYMPTIKPITALENYNDVLQDVTTYHPVYLTKDGYGRYVLTDMASYEEMHRKNLYYAELFKEMGIETDPPKGNAPLPYGFGCMKGKMWMSDDFDKPLENFA